MTFKYKLQVWIYDTKCRSLRLGRKVQRFYKKPVQENKYLFVLCAPYVGSTLLQELLSTSARVSPNNIFGTREGQGLPEFRRIVDYQKTWDKNYVYPWQEIKAIWHRYWDISKPVLLDKSPANMIRMEGLLTTFPNVYFIAMVRNPYAHCESLIRRDKMEAAAAAKFALKCLTYQMQNQELEANFLLLKYEDLVEQPKKTKAQLCSFLPEINDIETEKKFKAHNFKNQRLQLTNLNPEKIKRLTEHQLVQINQVFQEGEAVLKQFGYFLIK